MSIRKFVAVAQESGKMLYEGTELEAAIQAGIDAELPCELYQLGSNVGDRIGAFRQFPGTKVVGIDSNTTPEVRWHLRELTS